MVDLKDLQPQSGNINTVTESVQQPPSGVQVTEVKPSNTLNEGEAKEQEQIRAATEAAVPIDMDENYTFTIEYASHKVTVEPEQGLNYNFKASCTCHWTGRFLEAGQAEAGAKNHLNAKFPRRG